MIELALKVKLSKIGVFLDQIMRARWSWPCLQLFSLRRTLYKDIANYPKFKALMYGIFLYFFITIAKQIT